MAIEIYRLSIILLDLIVNTNSRVFQVGEHFFSWDCVIKNMFCLAIYTVCSLEGTMVLNFRLLQFPHILLSIPVVFGEIMPFCMFNKMNCFVLLDFYCLPSYNCINVYS
jgi:hypothetical protein